MSVFLPPFSHPSSPPLQFSENPFFRALESKSESSIAQLVHSKIFNVNPSELIDKAPHVLTFLSTCGWDIKNILFSIQTMRSMLLGLFVKDWKTIEQIAPITFTLPSWSDPQLIFEFKVLEKLFKNARQKPQNFLSPFFQDVISEYYIDSPYVNEPLKHCFDPFVDPNLIKQIKEALRFLSFHLSQTRPNKQRCKGLKIAKLTKKHLFSLNYINQNPENLEGYNFLEPLLKEDEFIPVPFFTKSSLLKKKIELDPQSPHPYLALGRIFRKDKVLYLNNGEETTAQKLFLKAISINPNDLDAYHALGKTLSPQERIYILREESLSSWYTNQKLYEFVLNSNANLPPVLFDLAMTIPLEETYNTHTRISLLAKAISIIRKEQPKKKYAKFFFEYANCIPIEQLQEKMDLYMEALQYNPEHGPSYLALALVIPHHSQVVISGSKLNKMDLLLNAIKFDPKNGVAYYHLANCFFLSPLPHHPKNIQKAIEHYLLSIHLTPSYLPSYIQLAHLMRSGTCIRLLNGQTKTKKELFKIALNINPFDPPYFISTDPLSLNRIPFENVGKKINGKLRAPKDSEIFYFIGKNEHTLNWLSKDKLNQKYLNS